MASFEDVSNGVVVYGDCLPPIFKEQFEQTALDHPDLTPEETFMMACSKVGKLAAQAEEPKKVA